MNLLANRNYLAVNVKALNSSWKYGKAFTLLGHRTHIGEPRSFFGDTMFPDEAELYALDDFNHIKNDFTVYCEKPTAINLQYPQYLQNYDYFLISYNEYLRYCKNYGIPLRCR